MWYPDWVKLLGIDYGTKKVGVALSNDDGTMAFPSAVLKNEGDGELRKELTALIEREGVEKIIIGHSLNLDGEENSVAEGARELMTDLTLETGLPIELEPEQFTSKEAERIQGRNDMTDASAAAIILNSYITKQKNNT